MAKIRVLVTDDHTLFRQGMKTLVGSEPDMEIVGEAANAADAIAQAAESKPDVVLMDIGMQGLSSFEATRQIRKERPETRILFLTMYDDEDYLVECMESASRGALCESGGWLQSCSVLAFQYPSGRRPAWIRNARTEQL